jgi:hypothetical protein
MPSYVCSHGCGYSSPYSSTLKAHEVRKHSTTRSFVCGAEHCAYAAATRADLASHAHRHAGSRPFACAEPGCSYRGALTRSCLASHAARHHGGASHACGLGGCTYSTGLAVKLRDHQRRMHSESGALACKRCEFTVTDHTQLLKHIRSHNGKEKKAKAVGGEALEALV